MLLPSLYFSACSVKQIAVSVTVLTFQVVQSVPVWLLAVLFALKNVTLEDFVCL